MNKTFLRDAAILHPHLILPPYDEVLNMDGFDAICAFSQAFSGGSVYVPSLRSIFKGCIEQEIRNKYNNNKKNIRALAKDYTVSERYIRSLVQ